MDLSFSVSLCGGARPWAADSSRHPMAVLPQIVDAYGQEINQSFFLGTKQVCETETFLERKGISALLYQEVCEYFQSGEDVMKKLKDTIFLTLGWKMSWQVLA